MIRRHSLSAVCMHWFNAFCWIALLFTGFALLAQPGSCSPWATWWSSISWTGAFGALRAAQAATSLDRHRRGSSVYAAYLHRPGCAAAEALPFLKEVFSRSAHRPPIMVWCLRKGYAPRPRGNGSCAASGSTPTLPPQGFYNAGQKLAAVAAVLCSVGLALSGLFLAALALHLVAPGSEDARRSGPCSSICSARA